MAHELPALPVYPGPDAGDAALAQFRADLDLYRAATDRLHAEAGDAAARAQKKLADAAPPPPPKAWTRESIALRFAESILQRSGSVISGAPSAQQAVDQATLAADAFIACHPGILQS